MGMGTFNPEVENRIHQHIIGALADEFGVTEATVSALYEQELSSLSMQAHIKQYLSLLTARHVKEMLRNSVTSYR